VEELREFLASSEFASPLRFWIGSALLLFFLFLPLSRKKRGLALDLGHWQRRVALRSGRRWVLPVLVVITSILMAVILTDPRIATRQSVPINGKPVMIVIDVSGSMEYKGYAGLDELSTFEKARQAYYDILSRDIEADYGLLLYSTESYIPRLFTVKEEMLRDTVENDEEVVFISTGTRTAEALAKARTFFLKRKDALDKAIVLITDLEVDVEAALQVAEELDRDVLAGIQVFVILTGRGSQRTQAERTSQLSTDGVQIVDMNDKVGVDRICAQIAAMQSSPIREEEIVSSRSLVPFLVVPTLGLIALSLVASETFLRKVP
jgi:hypothetical protein